MYKRCPLPLSPVQIHSDDPKFSCHVRVSSDKTSNGSTMVKVSGKSFCSLASLPSSCESLLPCSCLDRKHLLVENSRARPAILEFCLPDYFSSCWGWGQGRKLKNDASGDRIKSYGKPEVGQSLVTTTLFTTLKFPKNTGNVFNYNLLKSNCLVL